MKTRTIGKWKRHLASILGAGVCFQAVQCNIDTETLLPEYILTVAGLFISDWVNSLFGVAPSFF